MNGRPDRRIGIFHCLALPLIILVFATPLHAQLSLRLSAAGFDAAPQLPTWQRAQDLPQPLLLTEHEYRYGNLARLSSSNAPRALTGLLAANENDTNCNRYGGNDKLKHAGLFFLSTLSLQYVFETKLSLSKPVAFLLSAAIGSAIGVGKEYYDWKNNKCFNEGDLIANTAGIVSAGIIILTF